MLRLSNIQHLTNQQHCDLNNVYEKDRKNMQENTVLVKIQ